MDTTLTNLQEKFTDLLAEGDEFVLHKEKRSDQEGNIQMQTRKTADSQSEAKRIALQMYDNAGKRDKIFVRRTDSGWEIVHQTRYYINT